MKIIIALFCSVLFFSCAPESKKTGVLHNVSHETAICDFYRAHIRFDGDSLLTNSKGEPYGRSMAGDFTISKQAFDTLQYRIGDSIAITYVDRTAIVCEEGKLITSVVILK